MAIFKNVSIDTKANFYFNGKVTSRTVTFEDASVKTLGIMMPGEYEFGTSQYEVMEITRGDLEVKLPGSDKWERIISGESFEVEANRSFQVIVNEITDYCCSYLDK